MLEVGKGVDGFVPGDRVISNGPHAEVVCGGRILVLDNFRRLTGFGWKGFRSDRLWKQDKGHAAEVAAFVTAVEKGGPPPIPFDQIVEVTRITFEASKAVRLACISSGYDSAEIKRP